MKTTVTRREFISAFAELRPDNFSRPGLDLLFDYLEELEQNIGSEMEFDVIGICCDYAEDDWADIARNYSINLNDCGDDDECMHAVRAYLEDEGDYIGESTPGAFVYRQV